MQAEIPSKACEQTSRILHIQYNFRVTVIYHSGSMQFHGQCSSPGLFQSRHQRDINYGTGGFFFNRGLYRLIELEFQLPIGRSSGQLPATCPYFDISVVFRTQGDTVIG